ncbi:MAG TPA: hypothetical protein VK662_14895 [Acidothermaceae bacterium]|nr:hypothetical protein [Acidothermaceae bacterium]
MTGLNVVGCVTITASNVTFENSKVSGCTSDVGAISVSYGSQTGVLIDHVEITENGTPGIAGAGFTVNAANIHGTSDGIDVQNNDVVTNSYVHGLIVPPAAHVDSLQTAGGNALLVNHNTFDSACGSCNSAVIIGADLGAFTGQQTIENNLLAGGAYTAFAGSGGYNATNMISFVNNRFVNDADYGQCSFNVAVAFTGNVMDNTDSSLSCSG